MLPVFIKNYMEFSYSLVVYMTLPFIAKAYFKNIPRRYIWIICLVNSGLGYYYFFIDALYRGGESSIEAAIIWGIISYIYLRHSSKMLTTLTAQCEKLQQESIGKDRKISLLKSELEQTSFEKNKQNTLLKAQIEKLQKNQQQSQITINKLQESNSSLEKECRIKRNGPSSDIIIDYKLSYFTERDYASRARLHAFDATEYWVIDISQKRTSIYTLGKEITVRNVPFGWKIEENTENGYYQIHIHGMTNTERDALENRPVS